MTFYECAMGSKLFGAGKRRSVESVLNEILCRNVDFTELTKLSEIQRNNVQPQEIYKSCYNMMPRRDNSVGANNIEYISRFEDLVRGLLCRNQSERLGYESVNEIREHPFFVSINWTTLSYSQTAWKPEPHEGIMDAKALLWFGATLRCKLIRASFSMAKTTSIRTGKGVSSRDSKRGSMRIQVNRRLNEEKQKFEHVRARRLDWLRSGRPISSTRNYFEIDRSTAMPQIDEGMRVGEHSESDESQSKSHDWTRSAKGTKSDTLTDTMDLSESVTVSAQSESQHLPTLMERQPRPLGAAISTINTNSAANRMASVNK